MKKILLIILSMLIVLPSCINNKQVVKRERIYSYRAYEKFGELTPDNKDFFVDVIDYDKNGYKIKEVSYNQDGSKNYEKFIKYNSYTDKGIIINSTYYKNGVPERRKVYFDESQDKWITLQNEQEIDINFGGLFITEYTDDYIKSLSNQYEVINLITECEGEYTKFDENNNWIEGYFKIFFSNIKKEYVRLFKREILEIW